MQETNRICIDENGIHIVFGLHDQKLRLLHFSAAELEDSQLGKWPETDMYFPVEVQAAGRNRPSNWHGAKNVQTSPGYELLMRGMKDSRNQWGRKLEFETFDRDSGLVVTLHYQLYDGIPVVRSWTAVRNEGAEPQVLESVSSFCLMGICKEGMSSPQEKMRLLVPHHSWKKEMHWNSYSLKDFGLTDLSRPDTEEAESSQVLTVGNTGSWSAKEYLPMAYLENQESGTSIYWQIEHNGSWHWEISDFERQYYLELSGPDELHSHWWKELLPGDEFETVPVCVGVGTADFDTAMGYLTQYRRRIRRNNADNERLPVIFNDYMNCLSGNPTTSKELELIPKAKEAGCEYYVIDCGWYADGAWWDEVGEWMPSEKRFPDGFSKLLHIIRAAGIIPGVWLELEVMGVHCPLAKKLPDSWFFMRHGRRVCDKGRYQLDYRNPEVRAYAEKVVDRVVREYGVGYIKMDYNIEAGIGTETGADSAGEGLLGHNRAYLKWIETVFKKYPDLVIENCSSGGMRTDYAMLSLHSIQSTSDLTDYRHYAVIAANAPAAVTPEQAAVWSYPLTLGDKEETVFNMVNAMLLRIHQSGHLANLCQERFNLVKEGIACYKRIREDIKIALPFWPLGLASYGDTWCSLGLRTKEKIYLAVWRNGSKEATHSFPIDFLKGREVKVSCIYPKQEDCRFSWQPISGRLTVELPAQISARLFEMKAEL